MSEREKERESESERNRERIRERNRERNREKQREKERNRERERMYGGPAGGGRPCTPGPASPAAPAPFDQPSKLYLTTGQKCL